jgi:hypothetical protein
MFHDPIIVNAIGLYLASSGSARTAVSFTLLWAGGSITLAPELKASSTLAHQQ